jgi:hypothetical protein
MNPTLPGIACAALSCILLACLGDAAAGPTGQVGGDPPKAAAPAKLALSARARNCELEAVGETIDVIRYSDPATTRSHVETIRHAVGHCTRFVLAVALPDEVRRFCSVPDSLTAVQMARELRRRIAAIESDKLLRSSTPGQACRSAYAHELKTRRVVLRQRT